METIDEIETETKRLLDKKPQDLTVGDNIKVGLGIAAVYVAVPVVIFGVAAAVGSAKDFIQKRKLEKARNETTIDDTTE